MVTHASAKMPVIDMTNEDDEGVIMAPSPLKRLASYHGEPAQDAVDSQKKARIAMLIGEVHCERRELREAALPHLEAI